MDFFRASRQRLVLLHPIPQEAVCQQQRERPTMRLGRASTYDATLRQWQPLSFIGSHEVRPTKIPPFGFLNYADTPIRRYAHTQSPPDTRSGFRCCWAAPRSESEHSALLAQGAGPLAMSVPYQFRNEQSS
jgi:hypothetical protein